MIVQAPTLMLVQVLTHILVQVLTHILVQVLTHILVQVLIMDIQPTVFKLKTVPEQQKFIVVSILA